MRQQGGKPAGETVRGRDGAGGRDRNWGRESWAESMKGQIGR